ncbi:hypothetical protein niasHT_020842 [Heterodera trifolii]|uniref:14-3-3 domain-containing protein n=1 Tax=Heterodera trifolii TaxID=157864 RepID=A0ABD2KLS5_9BILA
MSHNPKKAKKEMEKAIFIAADCWLCVFDLLPRSQLGHGIALISHRFDFYVDEHFKTRKWTLGYMEIRSKIGENGTKEMEVVNANGETLPIPQNPLPRKFIGFGSLSITYIDQNVLTFLHRFHRFFGTFETRFLIRTENVRISMFALRTIWPMFIDTIRVKRFNSVAFRQMRQFAPSMLSECPCLRDGISPEFPPDDSAAASDGQAVAKWLFTPRPDNLAKVLSLAKLAVVKQQWVATLEQIKAVMQSYREHVENELVTICQELLTCINEVLFPKATDPEPKMFYLKMKADYYRYMAEVATDKDRSGVVELAKAAYQEAMEIATSKIAAINPTRLGLALNFSVFNFEILKSVDEARKVAQKAIDLAQAEIATLTVPLADDASSNLRMLRENMELWTPEGGSHTKTT